MDYCIRGIGAHLREALQMELLDTLGLDAWWRASSEGLLITDLDGWIRSINPRLLALFGLKETPASLQELVAATRGTLPELATAFDIDRPAGALRWGSVLVHRPMLQRLYWEQIPLEDNGQPAGICTIFRDTTTQTDRDVSRQAFLAMISHDLRTPLSAILGFSEMLRYNREALSNEVQQELLDSIIRNANDLSRFTQLALDVMYLEADIESLETEPVALDHFVQQWLNDAMHRIPAGQVLFRNGVSVPLPVRTSPAALHRILQILVDFALAESPTGHPVELSVDFNTVRAHIRIRHEAPHLAPADAAGLFKLFQPRDLSEHARPQFHRIQLYVANLLAERQHGMLTLLSEPDAVYQLDLALPLEISGR